MRPWEVRGDLDEAVGKSVGTSKRPWGKSPRPSEGQLDRKIVFVGMSVGKSPGQNRPVGRVGSKDCRFTEVEQSQELHELIRLSTRIVNPRRPRGKSCPFRVGTP